MKSVRSVSFHMILRYMKSDSFYNDLFIGQLLAATFLLPPPPICNFNGLRPVRSTTLLNEARM